VGWPAATTCNEKLRSTKGAAKRAPDLDEKENIDIYDEVLTKGG